MKFIAHPDRRWLAAHSVAMERSPYPTSRRVAAETTRGKYQPHQNTRECNRRQARMEVAVAA
jgi:hypothetical protein